MNTPWGKWEVLLEEPEYKVKRIVVNPGHRLSYQVHSRRSEHWMIVKGNALVTLDGKPRTVETGKTIDIPVGTAHRIQNPGKEPLSFIEIQTGDYFGEDDIVRLEDDYDRANKVG
jgi:mannose-6-phosphate isomerase-like protein (cupin superfamily)